MYVVAVPRVSPQDVERLARALRVTALEARAHCIGPGPRVVAVRGDPAQAQALADALAAEGFTPLVLDEAALDARSGRFVVRAFTVHDDRLRVAHRDGREGDLVFADVLHVLRGMAWRADSRTTTSTSTKLSMKRVVLTGGLMPVKTTTTTTTQSTVERAAFLDVVTAAGTFTFDETDVLYDGLGAALTPTRATNFLRLIDLLRARTPHAPYDDRLLTRPGQVAIVGTSVPPEVELDVAIALALAVPP